MGDRLHHTLINPNQLQSYGVDVQDNSFAKEDLAIITANYIIPLDTQGTTIFCDTRSPTEVELQWLPRVILLSAIDWIHRKCNSLPIAQKGLFQTPPHNAHVTLVFIKQHMTQSISLPGLSNKFMLIGQTGNRTQPYDTTFLPQGLSSPKNVIWGQPRWTSASGGMLDCHRPIPH